MKRSGTVRIIAHRGILPMLLAGCAATVCAQAPDTVSLFQCHRSAMDTHPLNEQKDLYMQAKDLNQKNYSVNWLPTLDLNGKYSWQNEVVQLPFAQMIPGFETPLMPHYNYKLTLDIQKTLYDGGMAHRGRELEEKAYQVNRQKVEVSLNQLKDRVNSVYFFILVLQEQEKTLRLKNDELQARLQVMESRLRNETVLASDLNVLKAEKLKAEQQLAELTISRESAVAVLSDLTSLEISDGTVLALPTAEIGSADESIYGSSGESLLPEQVLYDMQISKLDANIRLASRQLYPKAFVFGQFGYGNPALDFFRDEFRGYYIVGAGFQWRIWDWSRTSREKQVMAVQQDIIRSEKETFDRNLSIQLEELTANIIKYEEAVQRDSAILQLREEITRAAVSKLENGIITSTDYVTELDAEVQARTQLDLHRIQLEQARIDFLTCKGII
jgi:outer membrane protein TolC